MSDSTLERIARAIDPEAWSFGRKAISGRQAHAIQKARAVAEAPLTDAVIEAMARAIERTVLGCKVDAHVVIANPEDVARAAYEAQRAAILEGH